MPLTEPESFVRTAGPRTPPGCYDIDRRHSRVELRSPLPWSRGGPGEFTDFAGRIHVDGAASGGIGVYVCAHTGSLRSATGRRDRVLTGPDVLDSAVFPMLSCRFEHFGHSGGTARRRARGHLFIKDLELPVQASFRLDEAGSDAMGARLRLSLTTEFDPADWGVSWRTPVRRAVTVWERTRLLLTLSASRSPAPRLAS
ncbi:YceI family protein [Streptomyces justiciae]|uniref:YceI family protein n=1 Tax=Streptomyces justiciae TaxID=2780140 RepID=UPI0021173E04|nr:YceI family protein [Streptomyces justiciae]MCW8384516.1 YceI family protein [Streptomyces justiciae]